MVGIREEVERDSSSNDGEQVGNLAGTGPSEGGLEIRKVGTRGDSGGGVKDVRHDD